jgi:hypothetical protein
MANEYSLSEEEWLFQHRRLFLRVVAWVQTLRETRRRLKIKQQLVRCIPWLPSYFSPAIQAFHARNLESAWLDFFKGLLGV